MKNYLILAYHRVLPNELAQSRSPLAVSTVQFDRQIQLLVHRGWRSLTLSEFYAEFITLGKKLKKVFVVTFDDGYRDNYLFAFPILQKYNIKATIFLVTDLLDTSKYLYFTDALMPYEFSDIDRSLTLEQIQKMSDYGIEFGSHTLTHARLDAIELAEAEQEIYQSKKKLEQYLNCEVKSFCYPYGALNNDVAELVRKSGYCCAVVTPSRSEINETTFTLHRSGVYQSDSLFKFRLKCTKLFYAIRKTNLWFLLKYEFNPKNRISTAGD